MARLVERAVQHLRAEELFAELDETPTFPYVPGPGASPPMSRCALPPEVCTRRAGRCEDLRSVSTERLGAGPLGVVPPEILGGVGERLRLLLGL
jgi:hypothetical protein